MTRTFNPSPEEFENMTKDRGVPRWFDFTPDERAKFARFFEHRYVEFSFRMEELGSRPEPKAMLRHWKKQMDYYKHVRKFCRMCLHHLNRRDNFMGSFPE